MNSNAISAFEYVCILVFLILGLGITHILSSLAEATFGYDTNKVTILQSDFTQTAYPLLPKSKVAGIIVSHTMAALTKTTQPMLVR